MSHTPKLAIEYFNMRGRPEAGRYCLWMANIDFNDIRVKREEFAANKAKGKYPMGQVPVLYVDGEMINQGAAINRYCAKLSGHYPTNDHLAALKVDSIVDDVSDASSAIAATFTEQDKKKVEETRKSINNGILTTLYTLLDKKAKESKSGFLVGDKLTLADITVWVVVKQWFNSGVLDHIDTKLTDKFPALSKYLETIGKIDSIKTATAKSETAVKTASA
jgi:glutathione S-transferase